MSKLRRAAPGTVPILRRAVELETLAEAAAIVEEVRLGGESALRQHAERLGDLEPGGEILFDRSRLEAALASPTIEERGVLERVAGRIRSFAQAQRDSLQDLDIDVTGGRAGHRWIPVSSAGAYAPGGRYPLPSSVLMTVIPARVAEVKAVWVASPRPTPVTVAAAAVAGADGLLAVGGAQAIAALAFGTLTPACDLVVGPGNRWVTAAKKHLYGEIGIDGLAGPSELVVVASDGADPELVALDLSAQAEHGPDGLLVLAADTPELLEAVLDRVEGDATVYAVVLDPVAGLALSEDLAPEHLELVGTEAEALADRVRRAGALYVGNQAATAFGDYVAGSNHVLPTGGAARFQSALSASTFRRRMARVTFPGDSATKLAPAGAAVARAEGFPVHAESMERRA